ncbi:hypothetical protein OROGR_029178 [Orobanche gracilis]
MARDGGVLTATNGLPRRRWRRCSRPKGSFIGKARLCNCWSGSSGTAAGRTQWRRFDESLTAELRFQSDLIRPVRLVVLDSSGRVAAHRRCGGSSRPGSDSGRIVIVEGWAERYFLRLRKNTGQKLQFGG